MPKTKSPAKTQEQRNQEFLALPQEQQRVWIAQDAIHEILVDRYRVRTGTYFSVNLQEYPEAGDVLDLQTTLRRRKFVQCTVCARGAVFASAVRLSNGVRIDTSVDIAYDNDTDTRELVYTRSDAVFHKKEMEAFDDRQLRLMECAFETDTYHRHNTDEIEETDPRFISGNQALEAVEFGYQFHADDDRLLAILQNVIDHDGEFVPSDWKVQLPTLVKK